jgi:hypothetical protein
MQATKTTTTSAAGLMDLLLRSGEALRNWRALATLMGTGVAAMVLFMALAATGNGVVIFLAVLLAYAVISIGVSATGILLMDQALELTPRSISAALMDGLFAAMRLFVIVLIGFAVALLAVLAVAIVLVVCKIPGLGGFLYALALPVCVLTLAFVYAGLYFVFSLAGASVWSGASIRQAVSALYVIVTRRLVESALGVIVHSLILLLVGSVITVFMFAGVAAVLGLSAGILGSSVSMPSLSMMTGGASGGGGLVYGGIFGFGILFALVGAVFMSMAILGLNRLYLHLTRDLDLVGAEAALGERMDAAKERARAMQDEARRRTEEMRQRAQTAKPAVSPVPVTPPAAKVAAVPTCPKCSEPITADDAFCGSCGHKLQ